MDPWENKLRSARPVVPPLPPDFAARAMAEIARRGLTILPARVHRLRAWWRRGAALLLLVLAALLVNGVVFELRMNGALELLFFRFRFLGGFLGALPYDLLGSALALGALAAWLVRQGSLARVPVAWVLLVSYGLTGGGGVALAVTGVNETLQDEALAERLPVAPLAWFYRHRAHYGAHDPRFRMGRVVEAAGGTALLETPTGERVRVTLPPGFRARVDENLRLGGAVRGDAFVADDAQHCDPERMRRYFHRRMMGGGGMGPGHMSPGGMGPGGMGPGGMGPGGMGPGGMGPGGMGPGGVGPGGMGPGGMGPGGMGPGSRR